MILWDQENKVRALQQLAPLQQYPVKILTVDIGSRETEGKWEFVWHLLKFSKHLKSPFSLCIPQSEQVWLITQNPGPIIDMLIQTQTKQRFHHKSRLSRRHHTEELSSFLWRISQTGSWSLFEPALQADGKHIEINILSHMNYRQRLKSRALIYGQSELSSSWSTDQLMICLRTCGDEVH